ncbi:MAG TPA: DUF3084 domain-containing protein [Fimbriimonadaceae bacterium]|nr:DUF3084 domain-containing protein [Fimbriimonadaceae bacterium]
MDIVGVGFILLLCVVGALIAYGADILGRHLGKKRLSFGKLRPRHTAALATAVAGFCIPLFTVVLVALISKDVRVWLIEGRRAIVERQNLVRDIAAQRKQFNAELEDLRRQRQELGQQVSRLKVSQTKLEASEKKQRQELGTTQTKLANESRRLKDAQIRRAEVERRYVALNKTYASLNKQYAYLESGFQKMQKDQDDTFRALDSELRTKEARLKELTAQYDTANKTFESSRVEFEKEIAARRTELEERRKELDGVNVMLADIRAEKDALERDAANLRTLISTTTKGLDQNLRISRTQPLVFRQGEELARIQLPPRVNADDARNALTSLLRSSRVLAEERGSRPSGERNEAADLVDIPTERGTITIDQQVDMLSKAVTDARTETVLIAYAFWNSFRGEFLPVRIEAFENPLVYSRGQKVAEVVVDGNGSEDGVLRQITQFLQGVVGQEAIRSGMIPAIGRERPIGEVTQEEMLQLVKDIKEARRNIRLQAVAAQDTRAADPLRLSFKLR